jgi:hypothetical protein
MMKTINTTDYRNKSITNRKKMSAAYVSKH